MGNSGSELVLSLREVAGERPAERASGEIPEADEAEDPSWLLSWNRADPAPGASSS